MPDVELIFKAVDETKKATDSATSNLKKMDDAAGTAGKGSTSLAQQFSKMAGVIVGGATMAGGVLIGLKQAFDFGEQGAMVLQTAESFEILLQKVGASPDLLNDLRRASRGTVDDMRIMSSTATLLAGANGELATSLANATPELMEIAKAANKLNPLLGDTTFLYESLAKGIKRASPMILDNLGLIIKIEEANQRYAKSIGKSVEALTAEELKIALLNETLRQGRILMDQAGGTTESATDSFQRLDATIKNLTDSAKTAFVPVLADAASALYLMITYSERIDDALSTHNETMKTTATSYQEYIVEMQRAAEVAGYSIDQYGNLIKSTMTFKGEVERVVTANYALTESQYEAMKAQEASIESLQRMAGGLSMAASAANQTAAEMGGVTTAIIDLTKANLGAEAIKNLDQALKDGQITQEAYDRAFDNIAFNMLELPVSSVVALRELRELNTTFATGEVSAMEYTAQIRELHESIQRMEGKEITVKVNLDIPDFDKIIGAPSYKPSTSSSSVGDDTKTGFASGGSMIIPPGYPRDSYRIGLTSGERVEVTKPGKQQQKPSVTNYFYGPTYFSSPQGDDLTTYGVN